MPIPPSPPPPFTTPAELWQAALAELRLQMTRATFHAWLSGSEVVAPASCLACLVIAVRNRPAEEWLTYRLRPVIERTLAGLAGYRVDIFFVGDSYAKEPLANLSPEQLPGVPAPFEEARAHKPGRESPLSTLQPALLAGSPSPSQSNRPVFNPDSDPSTRPAGDTAMSHSPHPTRVRIYSHLTASHFLHVEDALHIDKLRLFAGTYRPGAGMMAGTHAFVDTADARIIFDALARGEPDFDYQEYKGTAPQDGRPTVSRVLSISTKDEQVTIALQTGPGKVSPTGAITPHGRPDVVVNVTFPLYEARRLGAVVLAYLQAWEVLRMLYHHPVATGREGVSGPLPYVLVPATSDQGIAGATVGSDKPSLHRADPPQMIQAEAPVTGKLTRPLRYGDGRFVDGHNITEVQTFQRYITEKRKVPTSKAVLLEYYRQQRQYPAGAPPV